MTFEWDEAKAAANILNHRVSFEEAATVFHDVLATDLYDEDHSDDEARSIRIGEATQTGRILFVSYTERGDTIRIISARVANGRERREYETGET